MVYVDHDPMVAAYRAPLLAPNGHTALITADLRDPDSVLGHPELRRLIDVPEPVGVLMTAVLHFVADSWEPRGLVGRYMSAMAPGRCGPFAGDLRPASPAGDRGHPGDVRAGHELYPARTRAEFARLFDRLGLVQAQPGAEPAVTFVGLWERGTRGRRQRRISRLVLRRGRPP